MGQQLRHLHRGRRAVRARLLLPLCRCWIDIRVNFRLSDSDRLWLLLPVSLGIALSGANMWQHRRAYLRKRGGAGGCLEAQRRPGAKPAAGRRRR